MPTSTDPPSTLPSSLPELLSRVSAYSAQFPKNLSKALTDTSLKQYIRLVAIVGAYILLRPYIEKFFAWWMMPKDLRQQAEAARDADQIDPMTGLPRKFMTAPVGAAAIRGQPTPVGKTANVKEQGKDGAKTSSSAANSEWGSGARKRQTVVMEAWEKEQAQKREDEDTDGIDPVLLEGWDY